MEAEGGLVQFVEARPAPAPGGVTILNSIAPTHPARAVRASGPGRPPVVSPPAAVSNRAPSQSIGVQSGERDGGRGRVRQGSGGRDPVAHDVLQADGCNTAGGRRTILLLI